MRLLVAIDEHYERTPERRIYSTQGTTAHVFWSHLRGVFPDVVVLARVRDVSAPSESSALASGPGVEWAPIPDFKGAAECFKQLRQIRKSIRDAILSADAVLLRAPGIISALAFRELRRARRPFGVQVVGDPWEVFGVGQAGGILAPVYRVFFTRNLKKLCSAAVAVSYVSVSGLRHRYPCSESAYTTSWSDVCLPPTAIQDDSVRHRRLACRRSPADVPTLGLIGSMEQPYKGIDVFLKALAVLRRRGVAFQAKIVGEGKLRPSLERLCTQVGVADSVSFLGRLPAGDGIFSFLDGIDLFVLPSRTEGLPRAMIEAMARGCPAIGTRVGGIPDLLPSECMAAPGDVEGLAEIMGRLLGNPSEMEQLSVRSTQVAEQYRAEIAHQRRTAFLEELRSRTGA